MRVRCNVRCYNLVTICWMPMSWGRPLGPGCFCHDWGRILLYKPYHTHLQSFIYHIASCGTLNTFTKNYHKNVVQKEQTTNGLNCLFFSEPLLPQEHHWLPDKTEPDPEGEQETVPATLHQRLSVAACRRGHGIPWTQIVIVYQLSI